MIIGTNLVMPNQTGAVYASHQYNACFNPDFIHACCIVDVHVAQGKDVNKYKI